MKAIANDAVNRGNSDWRKSFLNVPLEKCKECERRATECKNEGDRNRYIEMGRLYLQDAKERQELLKQRGLI